LPQRSRNRDVASYVSTNQRATKNEKAGLFSRPSRSGKQNLLLRGDCVFGSFCYAELHDSLSFDLDGFTGLWIASQAGLAVSFHQPAESGDHKEPSSWSLTAVSAEVLENAAAVLLLVSTF
jgi:hypothetical protein